MSLDNLDNLLSQLTTARVIRDDELANAISRAILRLLRHGDSAFGVVFDQFGLVAEEEFKTWIGRRFPDIPAERFQACLASQLDDLLAAEKIEFRCGRIRALYGHSIRRILVGEMKWPETTLMHATCRKHLKAIIRDGLSPRSRSRVQLTSCRKYAKKIYDGHTVIAPAAMLSIDPERISPDDVTFRKPNSHVWLANWIPPEAIEIIKDF